MSIIIFLAQFIVNTLLYFFAFCMIGVTITSKKAALERTVFKYSSFNAVILFVRADKSTSDNLSYICIFSR